MSEMQGSVLVGRTDRDVADNCPAFQHVLQGRRRGAPADSGSAAADVEPLHVEPLACRPVPGEHPAYNGALAFTSVNYWRDRRLNEGFRPFQIQGELYRLQGPGE